MHKKIAVFGASGFPGIFVVNALLEAGFSVSVLSADVDKDKALLPPEVEIVGGNWMYHRELKRFLSTQDSVYCSLSVDMHEQAEDFHAETDGLREIINASLECGIKRISYMSSVLQYNQVENEDLWWVFKVKKDAVNYVRDSGIPFTIFYPSTFMENFTNSYRKGKTIRLIGKSRYPIYLVSAEDYANTVVKSFQILGTEDREYFIQGNDGYTLQDAAKLYIKQQSNEKLKIKNLSEFKVRLKSLFNAEWKFNLELFEALNNNTEIFISDDTEAELGKPKLSFTEFAKRN